MKKITFLLSFLSFTFFTGNQLQAQQLDATFSIVLGTKLQMVLHQDAIFQFSGDHTSSNITVIIKNVYNSLPSPGASGSASGLSYTSSGGKSGSANQMGTFEASFGAFVATTDEEVAFTLSGTISSGETITIPAGTVIQSVGNYGAAQTFNAGPYTAVISNSAFNGVIATMIAPADATAPVFENSTPSQSSVVQTGFTLSTDIDEAGTIYYVVVADGATAPTSAEVVAGTGNGGSGQVTSGNVAVSTGGFTNAFSVTSLSAGTAYDVYVVAQDDEGTPNLQASPTKIDVSTSAPTSVLVAATVFLEGAWDGSTAMNTILEDADLVSASAPYNGTNSHSGSESVASVAAVPNGAVDWVLVELREAGSAAGAVNSTRKGSAAGFLMGDGSIKATDGTSNLTVSLSGNTGTDYYVVIYHRNHLPIMSANAIVGSSGTLTIDFTSNSANTYQTTTALNSLAGGKFGMPAGDTNSSGSIDGTDLSTWRTNNGEVYSYSVSGIADFNLDGEINAVDRNDFHQKNTSKTRQVPST